MTTDNSRVEALGPAERIIQSLTQFTDHLVHNRPGVVRASPGRLPTWTQAYWKDEEGVRKVFLSMKGKKPVLLGTLQGSVVINANGQNAGEFRDPGLFTEVAVHLYEQVAQVWSMDNEFAARWASWAFQQDRRDLKVILAAFLLAQSRKGDPVRDGNEILFYDEDYRDVGEALLLVREKGKDLSPRQLLLVGEILALPEIHAINVRLGFASSAKNPLVRRYNKAVHKWLLHREQNPKAFDGLVKAGFRQTVCSLARRTHYKPLSEDFYRKLRWSQTQAPDGRRAIGLNLTFEAADTWEGLSEEEICERIVRERPNWKLLTAKIPNLTQAIAAAAVEAGVLSDKELIILTPTWEELGLLTVEPMASAWKAALQKAEDQRARNIAQNVKSKEAREGLQEAADVATAKALETATKNMRVYFIVDRSGSMHSSLSTAIQTISQFLGGFPLDRLHVSVFNTVAQEITIRAPKQVAVEAAFKGLSASGGTCYAEGVKVLAKYKPAADEDAILIFVGDQEGEPGDSLGRAIQASGLNPSAILMLNVERSRYASTVQQAAAHTGIPYVEIDTSIFAGDPYAITQTFRNLIASAPKSAARASTPRVTLVQEILKTPLLQKPVWACREIG